jgi:DNA-binding CsgD family transcriptional regulator
MSLAPYGRTESLTGKLAFDRVGDIVLTLGSPKFGGAYYQLFRAAFGIEACTVFAFSREGTPTPLVVECDSERRREQAWHLACDYSKGAFKHDPVIRANLQRTSCGAPVVYRLSADEVKDAGYRRHFYDEPALKRKVGVLGAVDGIVYYSSFYHGGADASISGSSELRLMRELAGFALKALRRHDVAMSPLVSTIDTAANENCDQADRHRSALAHLLMVLRNGPYKLSAREAEVCAHVVLGYSTLAISLNLDISVNTVATHRKRAYAKLGICSQNELFERYFTTVNGMSPSEPRAKN